MGRPAPNSLWTILRVAAGIAFLVYRWDKLLNPAGWQDMMTGLGFPAPLVFSVFISPKS